MRLIPFPHSRASHPPDASRVRNTRFLPLPLPVAFLLALASLGAGLPTPVLGTGLPIPALGAGLPTSPKPPTAGLPNRASYSLALAQQPDSVRAGRQGLDQWGRYPWYDSQNDALKPIRISLPWKWRFPTLFSIPAGWVQTFFWVLTALLLLLVVYSVYRAFADRGSTKQPPSQDFNLDDLQRQRRFQALPQAVRHASAGLLEEARRNYLDGNFAEAVIYLFSHQLVQLDRHHLIRLAKGKTNRQYLRELAGRSALGQIFAQTLVAFEDVFFGNHAIDRRRFESCWNRLDEFEILAARQTP